MTYSFALIAAEALGIIKSKLIDPNGHLSSWNLDLGDPCTSKWTGVECTNSTLVDGYLHVQELYDLVPLLYSFIFSSCYKHACISFRCNSYSTYVVFVC